MTTTRNSNRAEREAQGRRGERLAAWYLRLTGWRVLAQRIKTPRGEIDLIARRGRMVAFVEVKWRRSAGELDHAIDPYRLRRVVAAAAAVGHQYVRTGDDQRIDVLLLAPGKWPQRIENASAG